MRASTLRRPLAALAALALGATLSGCVASQRNDDSGSGSSASGGGTFVFGASADPIMFDPAFASEGETFRVTRQIFEGLVGTQPGTADPAPRLATSWKGSPDGLSWTFQLHDGVKFTDGTTFDAKAVCANFDRWYDWTGVNQSPNITYYYNNLFKGFKTSDDPSKQGGIYGGCTADSALQATVKLTQPFAGFVQALSLPAFSMQSPTAMAKYNADNTGGSEDDPRFSSYATAHPTGTGPFKLAKWDRGQQVTLVRNDDYWGQKAKLSKVVIRTIADGNARLQALRSGDIDGYDLVAPGDLAGLKKDGFTIAQRPAFNILYLGLNQAVPALADVRVRQAIAYAIDKKAVVSQSLPEGSTPADEFMPSTVGGYNPDVTKYPYDPAKAKALLAAAGQSNLTLDFDYPTDVSRPYMPDPAATFTAIQSQLQAVGIKVNPVAKKWSPDYLDAIQGTPNHGIHLLGWTGDYNDPDNFIGVFFGQKSNEFGFDDPALFQALTAARGIPTRDAQVPAYQAINKTISDFVPGIPIASPVPSLAFDAKVKGFQPSPVQDEVWNTISLSS